MGGCVGGLACSKKVCQAMIASAGKLTGANPIVALAKTQLASTNTAEKNAKDGLASSKQIMLKSKHQQKLADENSAHADSIKSKAEKQIAIAEKVKERINDPASIRHSISVEVGALKSAAARDSEAVSAMKETGKKGWAMAHMLDLQVDDLVKERKSLHGHLPHATDMGKKAIEEVIGKDRQAAKAMLKLAGDTRNSVKGNIPQEKSAEKRAKGLRSQVAARVKEAAQDIPPEPRVCVDLPGVRLKIDEDADLKEDGTTSHKMCTASCHKQVGCKESVFSKEHGCRLSREQTIEAVSYEDSYLSSYCGLRSKKEHLMDMLHKVYAHKPAAK